MPKFGLTMLEGTIQRWFKAEGEEIKAGEPLFEVETENSL
jgi:pyruvate dehydrogenase E2 component (dihydrolipoamide acetyltransferase)